MSVKTLKLVSSVCQITFTQMTPEYIIEYDSLKNLTIQEALNKISSIPGILLQDLKVMDLSYYNGRPLYPGTGVYIFRENKKIKLVGKAESMSFTERIPKHFDPRPFAWFNRLLQLVGGGLNNESDQEDFQKASIYAFEKMNLVLIHFKERDRIGRTERLLRAATECLNRFKGVRVHDLNIIVGEY